MDEQHTYERLVQIFSALDHKTLAERCALAAIIVNGASHRLDAQLAATRAAMPLLKRLIGQACKTVVDVRTAEGALFGEPPRLGSLKGNESPLELADDLEIDGEAEVTDGAA